ncbi:hypothetical protein ACLB2K_034026 [Fragaria x ananassa]
MKNTTKESNIEGRIVNLSSLGHQYSYPEGIRFDAINDESKYKKYYAYGQSKLANGLHAKELNRRLKEEGEDITANAVHPGTILTNLMRYDNLLHSAMKVLRLFFTKSIPQGAATTCFAALNPQVKGVSGEYFATAGCGADVRTGLKVRTSIRSPSSGAGDGTPPPQKTPAASPTIFIPRRVHSFPVFRRDHPKLQTKSISPETGKKWTRQGGEVVGDAAGVFWGGGAPSPAPEGGERTDIRTLSRVRTFASYPFYIYTHTGLLCYGFPSVRRRARARLHPSGLQQLPRPLSIPGESVLFQFSGKLLESAGVEARPRTVLYGGERTEIRIVKRCGRPHLRKVVYIYLYIYTQSVSATDGADFCPFAKFEVLGDLTGKLEFGGLAGDEKWLGKLLESAGVEARLRRRRTVANG